MIKRKQDKVDFGIWVPLKMIILPGILGILFLGLGLFQWVFLIFAGLNLLTAVYFLLARHIFATNDGRFQTRVQELLLESIVWEGKGKALDIGCGNGPLTILLAKRFPQAQITGVDYWGKNWDYSRQVCENNARLSEVNDRTTFRSASASALPYKDDNFDLVVSNLVFHEVRGVADKRELLREALRVLRPGGVFVFQDLFLLRAYFGTPEELMESIRSWGIKQVEFIPTHDQPFIPRIVKLPFMVGTIAIVRGVK